MNQEINNALRDIQVALGYSLESTVVPAGIDIAENVKIFVCYTDVNREMTIRHSKIQLEINADRIKVRVAKLNHGENLFIHQDRILNFLNIVKRNIHTNMINKETPYSDELLEELFTISSDKVYSAREMDRQISMAVQERTSALEKEHEAHLNAIIADIYTDIYYGIDRNAYSNRLHELKKKRYPMEYPPTMEFSETFLKTVNKE